MGEEEKKYKKREDWLRIWIEKCEENPYKKLAELRGKKEEKEECNDVFIYKTLIYPPKSTPPTKN